MFLPNLLVSVRCRCALLCVYPRQIDRIHEVSDCDDVFGPCVMNKGVDRCHVPVTFLLNIGRRFLASLRNRAETVSNALTLNLPANAAAFPIGHIPPATPLDDGTILFACHRFFPFSELVADDLRLRLFISSLCALCHSA